MLILPLILLLSACNSAPSPAAADDSLLKPLIRADRKATVFIFVSLDCPISNGYAPEIKRIVADYSKQNIGFFLVYTDTTASVADIQKHAHDFGYTAPTLADGRHERAKHFGIRVTPEVAVVAPDQSIRYRGRIDDRYTAPGQKRFLETTHDLRNALDAIVNDRPVPTERTEAIGCEL